MPLIVAPPTIPPDEEPIFAWNPGEIGNFTLTNNNHDAQKTSGGNTTHRSLRALTSHSSGKYYFEMTIIAGGADNQVQTGVGLATSSASLNTYLGIDTNSYAYYLNGTAYHNNGVIGAGSGVNVNDVMGFEVDLDTNSFTVDVNGTAQITSSLIGGQTLFPAVTGYVENGFIFRINTGDSAFVHTPPGGFSNWG